MEDVVSNLACRYIELYGKEADHIFSCGGRFEILGNHTDHNHGLCLASACNLEIVASVSKNNSEKVLFQSLGFDLDEVDLNDLSSKENEYQL